MRLALTKFYAFLSQPLYGWTRIALAVLAIPLAIAFTQPLWRISMTAPQYPNGLYMDVYAYKLDGGNNGQHIKEINTLNHYIGMHKIDRAELTDLDWIPFAFGLLLILTLRCAAIGNVTSLVDLTVVTGYVALFAMGRFVYKLYVFGHNLDPDAPIKLPPFTPAVFGTKHIANFTTESYPKLGAIGVGVFFLGVVGLLAYHLIRGRRESLSTAPPPPPSTAVPA